MHHDAKCIKIYIFNKIVCEIWKIRKISYHYLIRYCCPTGSLAAKVSISQNITGLIGDEYIPLTCSLINEAFEHITRISVFAKNKTDDFSSMNPISIFEPSKPAKLLSSGSYLNGRVTMTNILSTSTNATLTLNELQCEDILKY